MPKLIKNRKLQDNEWKLVRDESELEQSGKQIVTIDVYQAHEAELKDKLARAELGLLLKSDQGIDDLPQGFESAPVIAIDFPAFTDGRGYSIARDLLRYTSFKGELRAVGDVLLDQLHSMERCGFSAFELVDAADASKAEKCFDVFSEKYQRDALQEKPVYQR